MSDYVDDFDDQDAGLIDQEAINDILEKATDAVRGLGLTMRREDVMITVQQGQTIAMVPMIIRPSAKKKLKEDQDAKEAFNKMMGENARAQVDAEAEKIRKLAADPDELFKSFFEEEEVTEECDHFAPDGICVKCGTEVEI